VAHRTAGPVELTVCLTVSLGSCYWAPDQAQWSAVDLASAAWDLALVASL
jgi:hypothetical protein